ncbi:hypothetical protein GQ44DRAFT_734279 [Phaeosphaeriaceae sp. PMI808]|nr:hypothetical protein GQ44DRAFT_734279 [Phaeosphaeriaceae sp. PMI808]
MPATWCSKKLGYPPPEYPPTITLPIPILGEPLNAFACQEKGCSFISTSRPAIQQHCNKQHSWYYSPANNHHWSQVKQGATSAKNKASLILAKVQDTQQRQEEELKIAEGLVKNPDNTGWFNRNGWPKHLSNRNLAQLSQASRLPDRNDLILSQAAKVTELLIEQCIASLSTLSLETRRWLRSPKSSEIDTRHLQGSKTKTRSNAILSTLSDLSATASGLQ